MHRNHAAGGDQTVRLSSRWQHGQYNGRVGNAMRAGGLHKRSAHGWHGLAAILTVVAVRRARHRMTTLHRLFGSRRGIAVEGIRRKSDCQHRQKNWPNCAHR